MSRASAGLLAIVLAAASCGCGQTKKDAKRAPATAEQRARAESLGIDPGSPRGLARLRQEEAMAPVRESIQRSVVVGAPWHVLALSGGGQWGAFGAGFMKGWSERTRQGVEPRRPPFRIVTGTSTGSLIATFAFLGPDYDDALRDAYLGIQGDGDIFKDNMILGFVFGDALSSTAPLRKRLDRSITPQMVAKVAEQGRQGRRLFVGSVDLDNGTFKPWDLTAIAAQGGEAARQRYIDALMASTAIPVAFPPMVIDGATYVDGGVRRNIFLEVVASEAAQLRRNEASAPTKTTVYSLVNGTLDVGHQQVKRKVLDIAKRSVDILLDESTDGNLLRVYLLAQRNGLDFQMAQIPPKACPVESSAENQFDPKLMKCLYAEGERYARDEAEPWKSEPSLDSDRP